MATQDNAPNRRQLLRLLGLGLTGVALGCQPPQAAGDDPEGRGTSGTDAGDTDLAACDAPTPFETEGPFHVPGVPVRSELDLYGEDGTSLALELTVVDTACSPLPGATVEIWHCNQDGSYDDSPTHRYRGQQVADADATVRFHTLVPSRYKVSPTWTRPAHIHVKVHVAGAVVLTTQIYFENDPFNDADTILHEANVMAEVDDGQGGIRCRHELVVALA